MALAIISLKKKTLKCSETIFHMGVHVPNPTQKEYSNHQGSVGIYKANILLTSKQNETKVHKRGGREGGKTLFYYIFLLINQLSMKG